MQFACTQRANLYVVELKESCAYWMSNGFVLEEDDIPNQRLNRFSDCYLLKLPTNRPEDPSRCIEFPESDNEDSSSSSDDDSSDGEESSSANSSRSDSSSVSDSDDDKELQKAILQSMKIQ